MPGDEILDDQRDHWSSKPLTQETVIGNLTVVEAVKVLRD